MLRPRNSNNHKELLSAEMIEEYEELSRIAPTFGQSAPEGYSERARAFNAKCEELGATLMMVAE